MNISEETSLDCAETVLSPPQHVTKLDLDDMNFDEIDVTVSTRMLRVIWGFYSFQSSLLLSTLCVPSHLSYIFMLI